MSDRIQPGRVMMILRDSQVDDELVRQIALQAGPLQNMHRAPTKPSLVFVQYEDSSVTDRAIEIMKEFPTFKLVVPALKPKRPIDEYLGSGNSRQQRGGRSNDFELPSTRPADIWQNGHKNDDNKESQAAEDCNETAHSDSVLTAPSISKRRLSTRHRNEKSTSPAPEIEPDSQPIHARKRARMEETQVDTSRKQLDHNKERQTGNGASNEMVYLTDSEIVLPPEAMHPITPAATVESATDLLNIQNGNSSTQNSQEKIETRRRARTKKNDEEERRIDTAGQQSDNEVVSQAADAETMNSGPMEGPSSAQPSSSCALQQTERPVSSTSAMETTSGSENKATHNRIHSEGNIHTKTSEQEETNDIMRKMRGYVETIADEIKVMARYNRKMFQLKEDYYKKKRAIMEQDENRNIPVAKIKKIAKNNLETISSSGRAEENINIKLPDKLQNLSEAILHHSPRKISIRIKLPKPQISAVDLERILQSNEKGKIITKYYERNQTLLPLFRKQLSEMICDSYIAKEQSFSARDMQKYSELISKRFPPELKKTYFCRRDKSTKKQRATGLFYNRFYRCQERKLLLLKESKQLKVNDVNQKST